MTDRPTAAPPTRPGTPSRPSTGRDPRSIQEPLGPEDGPLHVRRRRIVLTPIPNEPRGAQPVVPEWHEGTTHVGPRLLHTTPIPPRPAAPATPLTPENRADTSTTLPNLPTVQGTPESPGQRALPDQGPHSSPLDPRPLVVHHAPAPPPTAPAARAARGAMAAPAVPAASPARPSPAPAPATTTPAAPATRTAPAAVPPTPPIDPARPAPGRTARDRRRTYRRRRATVLTLLLATTGAAAVGVHALTTPSRPGGTSTLGAAADAVRGVIDPGAAARASAAMERADLLASARTLAAGYSYDDALDAIHARPDLANQQTAELEAQIAAQKAALVPYTGPIEHIFFHSLIVDPKLAFDKVGGSADGYNMWMTTVSEFKKMLPLLRQKGYVLYDITEIAAYDSELGRWAPKPILLPPGKKPLILSQDDVSYYPYMNGDGFADRLVIDTDGRVATRVPQPDGTSKVTRDGDVVPILDDFVAAHPDFSYRGARGVLALTGYEGVLGYRTTDGTAAEQAATRKEASVVATALRQTGWRFASHSYTHNQYFSDASVTLGEMTSDVQRWKQRIEPTLGDTDIYISPFGYSLRDDDPRYRELIKDGGFSIFCSVGPGTTINYFGDNIQMARYNLDGYRMIKDAADVKERFFDPALVLDPTRPPLH